MPTVSEAVEQLVRATVDLPDAEMGPGCGESTTTRVFVSPFS
jgi:hypothetical protein